MRISRLKSIRACSKMSQYLKIGSIKWKLSITRLIVTIKRGVSMPDLTFAAIAVVFTIKKQ